MADQVDVAVIGYGPVGMTMAALLGQAGHRVLVLERYSGKYNLPRAAIFDDETMRTFARLGIAETMLPKLHVQRNYEWRNGVGELLIEHDFAEFGKSGWAEWYMMYQPDLEDALDALCANDPKVSVRFDARVTGIDQDADGVTLTVADGASVRAQFVIGCDGGNSFTREAIGTALTDYGFSEPWMVCDFRMLTDAALPTARQVCDPNQPISIIALGHHHHRFSFMLNSADEFATESVPERVWARVAAYLRPDQAELIRCATYTFKSLIADDWRDGRVLLAGDAAHQMPPFLGQGMCSGVRDALNLSLKLNLVLDGHDLAVLDTYQSERAPHVLAVTRKGIELGRVQTERDPVAAARRDAELKAQHAAKERPEKIAFPGLGPGLFAGGDAAGNLFPQGRIARAGNVGRFDAIVGYGPVVIADAALRDTVSPDLLAAAPAGVQLVFVSRDGDDGDAYHDIDGTYFDWLDKHGCRVVAVRPDFHVWGTATGAEGLADFLRELAVFRWRAPAAADQAA